MTKMLRGALKCRKTCGLGCRELVRPILNIPFVARAERSLAKSLNSRLECSGSRISEVVPRKAVLHFEHDIRTPLFGTFLLFEPVRYYCRIIRTVSDDNV